LRARVTDAEDAIGLKVWGRRSVVVKRMVPGCSLYVYGTGDVEGNDRDSLGEMNTVRDTVILRDAIR